MQVKPAPPTPDRTVTCLNCGTEFVGPHCHACGQREAGRITMRGVGSEFANQFVALDRGLWYTVVQLTRNPGDVIRRYLAGQRRRYVGPAAYLLYATAVLLLASRGLAKLELEGLRASARRLTRGANPLLTPEQAEAFAGVMHAVSGQMTYSTLALAVPFALLLRLLFRKSGVNLAECAVFTLYVLGHACVYYLAFIPYLLLGPRGTEPMMWATIAVYTFTCLHAALGFFGATAGTAVRALAALVLSYLAFAVALIYGALGYALVFVR